MQAEKDVILGSQIGRGGYGKVYHSMYKDQDVAVKASAQPSCRMLAQR